MKNEKTQRQTKLRRSFLAWAGKYKPDTVSRCVLWLLLKKHSNGDSALFRKMQQLEKGENYEICIIFKSMFDKMGLNDEYLNAVEHGTILATKPLFSERTV